MGCLLKIGRVAENFLKVYNIMRREPNLTTDEAIKNWAWINKGSRVYCRYISWNNHVIVSPFDSAFEVTINLNECVFTQLFKAGETSGKHTARNKICEALGIGTVRK